MRSPLVEKEYAYKVSVVTAVYNVQKYVAEMIESIISQTIGIRNIQLILVDDGSTDDSGNICDSYAHKFPDNIFVYHKSNGGVSSARNYGLEHVEGKYVNFCDADDKLKSDALEKMYAFIEKESDKIDLVSIPEFFFDGKNGEHPLNYKFEATGIIDLDACYDYIQLSISSVLVKFVKVIRFDESLCYAEDAKVVNEILLEKKQYGVLHDTCYYYRKRADGSSAIDTGRNKKEYYIPYMERFITYLTKLSKEKTGAVPKFVQYLFLYELYWRFIAFPLVQIGVLNDLEIEEYIYRVKDALNYIDSEVVLKSRIPDSYKCAVIKLNNPNEYKVRFVEQTGELSQEVGDYTFSNIGLYPALFEFAHFDDSYMQLEGYVRGFLPSETFKLYFAFENDSGRYYADIYDHINKYDYFLGEVITYTTQFNVSVPIWNKKNSKLGLYLDYEGKSVRYENFLFGKFFPLSERIRNSYFFYNGLLLKHRKNAIILYSNVSKTRHIWCEIKLLWELLKRRDKYVRRGALARITYHVLKLFKRKKIWIIGDRPSRADDNGEAFFVFLCTKAKNLSIRTFFMLNKTSPDYARVEQIGNVLDYNSTKYKILALLCDLFVSSQGDDWVFNRFYSMAYIYRDIMYGQKFVFLQHGIIKDDLSKWLNRYNKNISLFVTSTLSEYRSVLQGDYGYTEKQVKLTGLPRYDFLYDDSNGRKIITIMPTWRAYLAGKYDAKMDSRVLLNDFANSTYCSMYRSLFNNDRLKDELEKNEYELQFMLHPSMPRECLELLGIEDRVEVLQANTRYRDIFSQSRLLITDYSSVVFDFAYLGKPVLYYQADKDEFFSGKHSYARGYFDYERDGFGEVAYDVETLVNLVIEYINNGCCLKEKYLKRINNTFYYHDKNNCARVYEQILKTE